MEKPAKWQHSVKLRSLYRHTENPLFLENKYIYMSCNIYMYELAVSECPASFDQLKILSSK